MWQPATVLSLDSSALNACNVHKLDVAEQCHELAYQDSQLHARTRLFKDMGYMAFSCMVPKAHKALPAITNAVTIDKGANRRQTELLGWKASAKCLKHTKLSLPSQKHTKLSL
jgi:hypothetical protein